MLETKPPAATSVPSMVKICQAPFISICNPVGIHIEIPLDIYPTEIECADKGYTESRKCRKRIVSLIEMHGTKIESR